MNKNYANTAFNLSPLAKARLGVKRSTLVTLSCLFPIVVQAEPTRLEDINVVAERESIPIRERKVAETIKTAKNFDTQQVQNSQDLVKYETGVSVVEKGRMGSSGYSIRGVDENRVNITIDGLQQAETLSSQGFKELFEGYGNFNNTRNGVEIETLKQVNIAKGADSAKSGSGALGGAVLFETKDARDYLMDKPYYFKVKTGYSSADRQYMVSPTVAARWKQFDILAIYTGRDGHETENFGYHSYPDIPQKGAQGRSRQKADPYHITKKSTLLKLGFNPNDSNRFTIMYDDYKHHSRGHDWSYTLAPLMTDANKPEKESRHTNDSSTRKNVAFSYENYDSNPLWDSLKITYSHQKITQRARTDEYCDGGENCDSVQNPLGLQFKDGDIVDKNGNKLTLKEVPAWEWNDDYSAQIKKENGKKTLAVVDAKGNVFPYPEKNQFDQNQNQSDLWDTSVDKGNLWLDCKAVNCNGALTYHNIEGNSWNGYKLKGKQSVDLNKPETILEVENPEGKRERILFSVNDHKNKDHFYKEVKVQKTKWIKKGDAWDDAQYEGWQADKINKWTGEKIGYENADNWQLIKPSSPGYSTNLWTDRKLNTDLKQINIDLTKLFNIKEVENELSYNFVLSKMDKQMINRSGYGPKNIKWWAKYFNTIDKNGQVACKPGTSCTIPYEEKPTTFLIPVETKTGAFAINDHIRVNRYVSFDVGYRYDHINHQPHFNKETDPALPQGLLHGMYVKPKTLTRPQKPSWYAKQFNCKTGTCKNPDGSYQDPKYAQALQEYEQNLADYLSNPQKNIDYLVGKKRKFSHSSYSLATAIDPFDFLRLQVKYATGFRAPSSDELYFTFKHPDFSIVANPDLKAELAKTKELALTFHHQQSFITLGAFKTNYDNFIQLAFQGYKQFTGKDGSTNGIPYRMYQNINNSKAWVKGFHVNSHLALGDITSMLEGLSVGYKLEYQKGRTFGIDENAQGEQRKIWYPINMISPMKQVFSMGYHHENKYGIDLYFTHVSAKKAKDTYNPYHAADQIREQSPNYDPNDISAKYLSKSYNIFDAIGYVKPMENLTIQLGVYNIFNKKYATWESLQSIRRFGTSNMICQAENPTIGCFSQNQGIERFYAPGRNFKVNVSMTF